MLPYSRRKFIKGLASIPLLFSSSLVFANSLFLKNKPNYSMEKNSKGHSYEPPYLKLHRSGELKKRADVLWDMMESCDICPRECNTNRLRGNRGDCNANSNLEVSSYHAHFGEEPELVGNNGSGTIFFTNCSLLCVFCINYDVSHLGRGRTYTTDDLANMMLALQNHGCHNINLVTPSHYVPQIMRGVDKAAGQGLRLPIVYNTCGWEKLEILQLLDGVVDIYLADFKYGDSKPAGKYSAGAYSYPEITKEAFLEMDRQVGVAKPDPDTGLVDRGLMVRHLVMPENVCRTDLIIEWIADNLPKDTYINIMSQYTPMYKAHDYDEISRRITLREYRQAVTWARRAGLTNVQVQGGI